MKLFQTLNIIKQYPKLYSPVQAQVNFKQSQIDLKISTNYY
jgi:hypothetical protein